MNLPPSRLLPCLAALAAASLAPAQEKAHLALDSPHASFVEEDFPFFCQTLDARELGEGWPADNLAPRGIILHLGHGVKACFDPDLLRVALVWKENAEGEYLTMNSMAPGSYRLPEKKADPGQKSLPRPLGVPLLASGLHAGWMTGAGSDAPSDPRDRGQADAGEAGLGPLPPELGRWTGLRLEGEGVVLEYEIAGAAIAERLSWDPAAGALVRELELAPHQTPLVLVSPAPAGEEPLLIPLAASAEALTLRVSGGAASPAAPDPGRGAPPPSRWPETLGGLSASRAPNSTGAWIIDQIDIPVPNPWRRSARFSAFAFFPDGRAALCTFDGDVWLAQGLAGDLDQVSWRRFASGLHEPQGLEIVDGAIYVFDRNGIVRLHDTSGDGEADFHENFCDLVPQTAETREFAMDLLAKPGGGFYLAKGGQVAGTRGKANGTVVEVAADGRSWEIVATGMRQPYLGVDPVSGLVTSSDQQGNWKPATPIYVVERGGYYGFQPFGGENAVHPAPIGEPALWIPHFVNPSGAGQVWLRGSRMGPLDGSLLHIGYHRPELFKIYLDERGPSRQGAVALVAGDFPTGLLKGRVHPGDGSLWLCGMKIWGTSASAVTGVYRVRPSGEPCWVPEEILSSDRGVLLRFGQAVDPAIAGEATGYAVDRWNYRLTHLYGSGNYKLDGEPGQETLPVASATLSRDGRSVFLGIPGMQPSDSLRVSYRRPVASETPQVQHAYLTVKHLLPVDLSALGFASDEVDLAWKESPAGAMAAVEPSVALGQQLSLQYGCIACHAVSREQLAAMEAAAAAGQAAAGVAGVVGPPWIGLWGAKREFTDGSLLRGVDEAYLRESIIDPARLVPKGFETEKTGVGMPSYLGVLKDHEIDSIILYIKSLAPEKQG